jgi:hypothetical protein
MAPDGTESATRKLATMMGSRLIMLTTEMESPAGSIAVASALVGQLARDVSLIHTSLMTSQSHAPAEMEPVLCTRCTEDVLGALTPSEGGH